MMEYLSSKPIAILGSGAVGKTLAADCKLAGAEVRLYGSPEFADKSLNMLGKTGITLGGVQRNRDCFERSGRAFVDLVSCDIAEVVRNAGIICVATTAWRHEGLFRKLIPVLEDSQMIMIFTDNWGSLLLRKMMREADCTKRVIVGGWSSAPYGTRLENINGWRFPKLNVKYRAITLRGAALPDYDSEKFLEAAKYLPAMDSVTHGDGTVKGDTVLDIDFANVNPVIHVPATILGVSTMENWGVLFGAGDYSMYSHALCKSICEVQYKFYGEEIAVADGLGVKCPVYKRDMFFSRRSILTQEYMGLNSEGNDNIVFPLSKASDEGSTGPDSIHHRYLTEDVPVSCKMYHDLGKIAGVRTPVIDAMITLGGAYHGRDFFRESRYSPEYLGIGGMDSQKLVRYLRTLEV